MQYKVCVHNISLTNGWNFQGHYIINTQKVSLVNAVKSCVHTLSLTNGWNLIKLA